MKKLIILFMSVGMLYAQRTTYGNIDTWEFNSMALPYEFPDDIKEDVAIPPKKDPEPVYIRYKVSTVTRSYYRGQFTGFRVSNGYYRIKITRRE